MRNQPFTDSVTIFRRKAIDARVAFESNATDLVSGVTNSSSTTDVFLWERATGTITLVSEASTGTATGNASSYWAHLSGDARYIAYKSSATNLVPAQADTADTTDAFLYDRVLDTTVLVSHQAASLVTATGIYFDPVQVSPGGDWVLFTSKATNLVSGQIDGNGEADVFLYEPATGTNRLVSRSPAGATTAGNDWAGNPTFSADARFVAFDSWATNHVAGVSDTNGVPDVFLFDRDAGTTALVSGTGPGSTTAANGVSRYPLVDPTGRYVVFLTGATNVLAGIADSANGDDLYRWDRLDGSRRLVSHAAASPTTAVGGVTPYYAAASVSRRGNAVLFQTDATGLVAGVSDTNGATDLFRWEAGTDAIELMSRTLASATTSGNGESSLGWFGPDGQLVLNHSVASDLAIDDHDGTEDHFANRAASIFGDDFEEGDDGAWDNSALP